MFQTGAKKNPKRPASSSRSETGSQTKYETKKRRAAAASAAESSAGREIGPLPPVKNPRRKKRCEKSLEAFCRTYFPARFPLPFSAAHRQAIERMETCTKEGDRFALAMMRGGGKTTIAECAVLHAIMYGLRRFVVLLQATERLAARSLKKIQRELESNELLAEDFPEVCFPVRALERIVNRARGQTLDGEPTRIEWTADGIALPTVASAPSSGAIVYVAGLTGAVRGLSVAGPVGEILRPDMVVIDDAQTRDSAKSATQTGDRLAIILDDVLGLAGPTVDIAAMNLCTPIYPGDLAEQFLDTQARPEWQGIRTKMLPAFPTRMDLWEQYADIRRDSLRSGDKGRRATKFYRDNRAAMDAGAVLTWPERRKKRDLSGLQTAMNLFFDNPRGFKAEYQCEPDKGDLGQDAKELLPASVAARLSGVPRLTVPKECSRVVAFIDPGVYLHWYAVVGWTERFGGSVIDYGTWPRQARSQFDARSAATKLKDRYPTLANSSTALVYAGLKDLLPEVLGRTYYSETGEEVKIERCLVDCGDEQTAVMQCIRQSDFAGIIHPSKGIGRTTTSRGVGEWTRREGEQSGHYWRLSIAEKSRLRMVQFDTDEWKSAIYDRLTTPPGGLIGLNLYGKDADAHMMLGEHCAAERSHPITLRGTTFHKWEPGPDRRDNHLWDTLVGCAVAASVQGLHWSAAAAAGEVEPQPVPEIQYIDFSETQRERIAERGAR